MYSPQLFLYYNFQESLQTIVSNRNYLRRDFATIYLTSLQGSSVRSIPALRHDVIQNKPLTLSPQPYR